MANEEQSADEYMRQFLLNMATTSTSRVNMLNKLFDDRRDLDTECGYPKEITPTQYRYLYDREGIATRVVSLYPEECWSEDPRIYETEDAENTPWELYLDDVISEHNLIHYMQRIDELSGIGEFGVLLLGIDDGKNLNEPIDGIILDGPHTGRKSGFAETAATGQDTSKQKESNEPSKHLMYITAFDQSQVEIDQYEKDEKNRRYGQPTMYSIKFSNPGSTNTESFQSKKVHWTRIIHIADGRKSSDVFGTPRMQIVFNRLYDLRKLLGSSAEMFYKGAFPGYAFEVNPDLTGVELDADAMREEFAAYANGLQRYLAINGVSAKSLSVQVASPEDHIMSQIKAIAIALKSPMRIFMGSEAAHLASTQDQKAWNRRLKQRQDKYLNPQLIRPVIDRLIAIDVLPEPTDGIYLIEWPDLNTPTDEDKAKVSESIIKAIATYIQSGADVLVPPFEFLTIIMKLETEVAEAILTAAEDMIDVEPEPEPEPPVEEDPLDA